MKRTAILICITAMTIAACGAGEWEGEVVEESTLQIDDRVHEVKPTWLGPLAWMATGAAGIAGISSETVQNFFKGGFDRAMNGTPSASATLESNPETRNLTPEQKQKLAEIEESGAKMAREILEQQRRTNELLGRLEKRYDQNGNPQQSFDPRRMPFDIFSGRTQPGRNPGGINPNQLPRGIGNPGSAFLYGSNGAQNYYNNWGGSNYQPPRNPGFYFGAGRYGPQNQMPPNRQWGPQNQYGGANRWQQPGWGAPGQRPPSGAFGSFNPNMQNPSFQGGPGYYPQFSNNQRFQPFVNPNARYPMHPGAGFPGAGGPAFGLQGRGMQQGFAGNYNGYNYGYGRGGLGGYRANYPAGLNSSANNFIQGTSTGEELAGLFEPCHDSNLAPDARLCDYNMACTRIVMEGTAGQEYYSVPRCLLVVTKDVEENPDASPDYLCGQLVDDQDKPLVDLNGDDISQFVIAETVVESGQSEFVCSLF